MAEFNFSLIRARLKWNLIEFAEFIFTELRVTHKMYQRKKKRTHTFSSDSERTRFAHEELCSFIHHPVNVCHAIGRMDEPIDQLFLAATSSYRCQATTAMQRDVGRWAMEYRNSSIRISPQIRPFDFFYITQTPNSPGGRGCASCALSAHVDR